MAAQSSVAMPAHRQPNTTIGSLPSASPKRPDDDLENAVGDRKCRDDPGCRADAYRELARDLRQQRVAHAQVGSADESGKRKQRDSPRWACPRCPSISQYSRLIRIWPSAG